MWARIESVKSVSLSLRDSSVGILSQSTTTQYILSIKELDASFFTKFESISQILYKYVLHYYIHLLNILIDDNLHFL